MDKIKEENKLLKSKVARLEKETAYYKNLNKSLNRKNEELQSIRPLNESGVSILETNFILKTSDVESVVFLNAFGAETRLPKTHLSKMIKERGLNENISLILYGSKKV